MLKLSYQAIAALLLAMVAVGWLEFPVDELHGFTAALLTFFFVTLLLLKFVELLVRKLQSASAKSEIELGTGLLSLASEGEGHLVILIHGIRTYAAWMQTAIQVLEGEGYKVAPASYGRFDLLRFLFPGRFFKRKPIKRTEDDIRAAIEYYKPHSVSVIAHSFGTYVFCDILRRNPQMKWDRIILCGSVVKESFPIERFNERFSPPLLNEVGTKDIWPAVAQSITFGYGSVGTHGFNDPMVRSRWHHGLSHSDFLQAGFIRANWLPFLKSQTIEPGSTPASRPIATFLTVFHLKYVVPLAALLLYYLLS